MDSAKPTVCIGIPCYGDVSPEVLEDFMRFAYHCGRRLPQYDFFLAIKPKTEQFRARNAIVEAARQVNATWLLMLDDDMIVNPFVTSGPTDEYNLVERLIAHGKDVCGALYYQRGGACQPVLMTAVTDTGYRFLRTDELTYGPQKVDVAGGGCVLVHMRVFDKIPMPYFEPEFQFGTDIQLCRKAAAHGFEVWADTSVELGHVRQDRAIITGRNRQQYALEDPLSGEMKKQLVSADVFNRLAEDGCAYVQVPNVESLSHDIGVSSFLHKRADYQIPDADWYRLYPRERVARQLWFNHTDQKRKMTEFILASISDQKPLQILEFGCGIGILAFSLAERGHHVTACDIGGTSTLEFLKWRVAKHGQAMTFHESAGGIPALGSARYDVIIAMDSIEHVEDWRGVVRELSAHLKPDGVLACNNAILDDTSHPEHYTIGPHRFVAACAEVGLLPMNQLMYVKRTLKEHPDATIAHSQPRGVLQEAV